MTREEQLDALLITALSKLEDLPFAVDQARRDRNNAAGPVYQFGQWLRAEFIRTQAP